MAILTATNIANKKLGLDNKIEQVLKLISDGKSVRSACDAVKISRTTFTDNVKSDQYVYARRLGADMLFDEMMDLEQKCLAGEIKPATLKAVIDIRKWVLSRMRPDVYGDKPTSNIVCNECTKNSDPKSKNLDHLSLEELKILIDLLNKNEK